MFCPPKGRSGLVLCLKGQMLSVGGFQKCFISLFYAWNYFVSFQIQGISYWPLVGPLSNPSNVPQLLHCSFHKTFFFSFSLIDAILFAGYCGAGHSYFYIIWGQHTEKVVKFDRNTYVWICLKISSSRTLGFFILGFSTTAEYFGQAPHIF